ncbi:MAG: CARDB domain-containing protein [Actinopolymorphaceae bacterium]
MAAVTIGVVLAALPLHVAMGEPIDVADSFDRAAGPLGVSDSGHEWVDYRGDSAISEQAAALGKGYSLSAVTASTSGVEAAVTLRTVDQEQWLVVRLSSGSDYWRFGWHVGSGTYVLQLIQGDQLADGAVQLHSAVEPAAGDRLSCSSTTDGLHCKVNGALVASTSHDYNASARGVGIAAWNSPDGRFDDLAAVAIPLGEPEDPPTIPSGALIFDDFGGTVGALTGTHTGQPWVTHVGSWNTSGGLVSPSSGYALVSADAGQTDIVARTVLAAASDEFWLVMRLRDANNYWRFGRYSGGQYTLQLVANNQLAAPDLITSASETPADGDVLRCVTTAAAISCNVNGSEVVRSHDPPEAAATRTGLAAWNGTGARFDEFLVTEADQPPQLAAEVDIQGSPAVGAPAAVAMTVANPGTEAVQGVTGVLELSGTATIDDLTGTSPACTVTSATTLSCGLGTVAAGDAAAVEASFVATSAGSLHAELTVTATGLPEPVDVNDHATAWDDTGGLVVYDDFDRAGGSGLGQTVTEHTWHVWAGSAGITDGRLTFGSGYSLATVDSGLGMSTTSVTVVQPDHEFWLVTRLSDDANYWRFGRVAGGAYSLQKVDDNSLGNPVLVVSDQVFAVPGDRLSCTSTATSLSCFVDGEPVASSADSFNHAATSQGVAAYQPGTLRFDTFSAAEVPAVPDLATSVSAPSTAAVGSEVDITVSVRNNGSAAAGSIGLAGSAGGTIGSVTAGASTCQSAGSDLTCDLPDLGPGETADVQMAVELPAEPGDVVVAMAATLTAEDRTPADNAHSRTIRVRNPVMPGAGGVTDAFERPDQVSGLGVTETGEPWRVIVGDAGIEDSQARPVDGDSTMAVIDTAYAFGTFEISWPSVSGQFWTVFRVVDASNYYRFGPDSSASGYYRVQKVVDGQPQGLAFGQVRRQLRASPGDVVRIAQRPDDSIFISVNGEHVIDAGDQQFMDASSYGILLDGTQVRADDLVISSVIAAFPVTDEFDRADGPDVGVPTSGVRYQWQRWRGHEWSVGDGELYNSAGDYGVLMLDTSSEAADVAVTVTEASGEFGVVHRFSESGTFLRFGTFGGTGYQVERVTGYDTVEVPAALVAHTPVTPADGQRLEVRQQLDGTIEYYVDEVLAYSLIDSSTNPRGGHYGVTASSDDARFDNFHVVPRNL